MITCSMLPFVTASAVKVWFALLTLHVNVNIFVVFVRTLLHLLLTFTVYENSLF